MKKVLIGFAAAAVAVAGIGGAASAAQSSANSIYENVIDNEGNTDGPKLDALLEDAGIDDLIDNCSTLYTAFISEDLYQTLTSAATAILGYASAESFLELAPDTFKGILALHVVPGVYSAGSLKAGLFTNLTNLASLSLTIAPNSTGTSFTVNGLTYSGTSSDSCNGVVHYLDSELSNKLGLLTPPAKPGAPSCGANVVGACTPAGGSGSGSGLPKTGSESMALTYAALASLIAGAGVLVIRRRSIA